MTVNFWVQQLTVKGKSEGSGGTEQERTRVEQARVESHRRSPKEDR